MTNYTITHSNGTFLTTLSDSQAYNITDANTSITSGIVIFGQNYASYGQIIANNFLHLLENQSGAVAPIHPVIGQVWWDSANNLLKVFDGASWNSLTGSNTINSTLQGNLTLTGDLRTTTNATSNIGSAFNRFGNVYAYATNVISADLAELYTADQNYEPGTVLDFGGTFDVRESNMDYSSAVAGVVSTNPGYLMNSRCEGEHVVAVALQGRVPTKVTGIIVKGDCLVSAGKGRARAEKYPRTGTLIGKALENFAGEEGIIEVSVSRC